MELQRQNRQCTNKIAESPNSGIKRKYQSISNRDNIILKKKTATEKKNNSIETQLK